MKKMSVLFLTKYSREGASSRYRFFQFFPYFESHGIHCDFSNLTDFKYLETLYSRKERKGMTFFSFLFRRLGALSRAGRYDLVVIEYESLPYLPALPEIIFKYLKIPFIVNYDDATFYRYSLSLNPIFRALLGKKIDTVMKNANVVIAGNEYLADYARKAGAGKIEIMPTVVDLDRYPVSEHRNNDIFTIGWIGSPSTTKYLTAIGPALAKVCGDNGARVVLIGGSADFKLSGVPIEIKPWSEDSEIGDLQSCDVGIMPLEDGLWEKGKCGLKAIQYMACALPVIASPVGMNREIVEDGKTGYLANSNDEWINALESLKFDKGLRKRMGEAGRKKVERCYSLQIMAPRFYDLIVSVASGRRQ